MSQAKLFIKSNGNEDSTLVVLARVKHTDGTDITEANITDIVFSVHAQSDGSEIVAETALVKADVIEDPPVIDALRYGIDDPDESVQGYNFQFLIPETAFPEGNETYEVKVKFTTDGALSFNFKVLHTTSGLISS